MINEELVDTERREGEIAPILSLAGKRIMAENVGLWPYPGPCWSGNAELNKLWMKINEAGRPAQGKRQTMRKGERKKFSRYW